MSYSLGKTVNGKEIEAYMPDDRALYRIRFTSGGQIPVKLSGEYTSVGEAIRDVNIYLDSQPKTKAKE